MGQTREEFMSWVHSKYPNIFTQEEVSHYIKINAESIKGISYSAFVFMIEDVLKKGSNITYGRDIYTSKVRSIAHSWISGFDIGSIARLSTVLELPEFAPPIHIKDTDFGLPDHYPNGFYIENGQPVQFYPYKHPIEEGYHAITDLTPQREYRDIYLETTVLAHMLEIYHKKYLGGVQDGEKIKGKE